MLLINIIAGVCRSKHSGYTRLSSGGAAELVELEPVDASSAQPLSSAFPLDESSEAETTPSKSGDQAAKFESVVLHIVLRGH